MIQKFSIFSLFSLLLLVLAACAQEKEPLPETSNQTPRAMPDTYELSRASLFAVDASKGLLANDTDPEGQPLKARVLTLPLYGGLMLKPDGSFSYQHDGSQESVDSFSYELSDGEKSSSANVWLTIHTAAETAPGAEQDSYELKEGELLLVSAEQGLLANDSNPLTSGLSVSLLSPPEHGQLELKADGSFSYQHDHSETTLDSFIYSVANDVSSSMAMVSLRIDPVEDAPVVAQLELAQTHVISPEGKRWEAFPEDELHLIAEREALLLVSFSNEFVTEPEVEGFHGTLSLGRLSLNEPATLANTEANGRPYSETSYWTTLPASWLAPGLELSFLANGAQATEKRSVNVGAASRFSLYTLPFYLFGADESLVPFAESAVPDQSTIDELFAKWPVAQLEVKNHPAMKLKRDYIIVAPRQGRPAQRVNYKEEQGDGYAVMSAVLNTLGAIRSANGDANTSNQYYAPLIMASQSGAYSHPGGGLGGGHLGTGDYSYRGIFIHEQGHAFGIPHVGDAYNKGDWPYVGGSLLGSSWGYDSKRQEFLDIRVARSSNRYTNCSIERFAGNARQLDDEGYCIKQDPMQSGSGDSDPSYRFSTFSDFSNARMQRYFEGNTVLSSQGYSYQGGRIFVDQGSSTGYSRWNSLEKRLDEVLAETVQGGLYGLDRGLPYERNRLVQNVIISYSKAGTPGVSQIYPPLTYQGNLLRLLDPSRPEDLATIVPNTSENYWYCKASGCDYSLRIRFADQTERYVLLQGGFRKWFSDTQKDAALDPLSAESFRLWSLNLPADKALAGVELIETPEVWKGLPESPQVLLSCGFSSSTWACTE